MGNFSNLGFLFVVIKINTYIYIYILFFAHPQPWVWQLIVFTILHAVIETKQVVDTSRGEHLRVNFDFTFPALACSMLSLDAMDIGGEQHPDGKHDIIKRRLDSHGQVIESRQDGIGAPKTEKPLQRHGGRLEHDKTYCGSCYGAETECCNSCEEVREAYQKKGWGLSNPDLIDQLKGFLQKIKEEEGEGCNIYLFLEVNKVAGNFHCSWEKLSTIQCSCPRFTGIQKDSFNISHKINRLSFEDYFLVSVQWMQETPIGMYQYFIKVVPTVYTDVSGHPIQSNQFWVTEHFRNADLGKLQSMPGVFFFNDLSPIKFLVIYKTLLALGFIVLVTFNEEHVSFSHFLTNMCANVGGVFTVSGILDSFVYHGQKAIKNKMEIGKSS
ncbi:hypothetical protein ACJRO7_030558 [Eucalyptus globulus]|uniref:Endoplasmic reticulum-Golgi intermediate compartment protein 3 n=1 Tax=Eucalyptus globulus TaxID=34317 RepID=A0ABD3JF36_EUCGL